MGDTGAGEFYFNMTTGVVEDGRLSSWEHLIGPYPTYEEAAKALDTAAKRSAAWDEEDAKWNEDS